MSHNRASSEQKASDYPWNPNFDNSIGGEDSYMKEMGTIGFPRFSTFDDTTAAGGLSPRPQAVTRLNTWERRDDIGRAIA